MSHEDEINKLKSEIDDLNYELFELKQKIKFSKEDELKEFLRELYNSINVELEKKDSKFDADEYNKITKEDILNNLKSYIEEFKRNNKLFP